MTDTTNLENYLCDDCFVTEVKLYNTGEFLVYRFHLYFNLNESGIDFAAVTHSDRDAFGIFSY